MPLTAKTRLGTYEIVAPLGSGGMGEVNPARRWSWRPQRVGTHSVLSLALLAQNQDEDALAEAVREPEEAWRLWALAMIHNAIGDVAKSDAVLQDLAQKYGDDTASQVAEVYAASGDVVKTSPYLHSLHSDPRWAAFLAKMGLAT